MVLDMNLTEPAAVVAKVLLGEAVTEQELVEAIALHLSRQGGPARTVFGNCVYRAENGRKCAVGAILPDAAYMPSMDATEHEPGSALYYGTDVESLNSAGMLPASLRPHVTLLRNLQNVHDDLASWESDAAMEDTLIRACRRFPVDTYFLEGMTFVRDEVADAGSN